MDYEQLARQAQQQGNALQQRLDTQAAQGRQDYATQLGTARGAQADLSSFAKGIQGGGEQAQGYLQGQYQQLGINPQAIQQANQQIARTQAALQAAPQAAQQAGGGYGMTAGGQAQALANMQGNLSGVLTAQTAQSEALGKQMSQALANAQMIQQSQLASQQQKADAFKAAADNAAQLLNTAQGTMVSLEQLAQQQGTLTAQQVGSYMAAKSSAAAASAAYAQARLSEQTYSANARVEQEINAKKQSDEAAKRTAAEAASKPAYTPSAAYKLAQDKSFGGAVKRGVRRIFKGY